MLAGGQIAFTSVKLDNDVNVDVGASVTILARGAIAIAADSQTTASTDSYTVAGGAGAGADSNNTFDNYPARHAHRQLRQHAQRGVTIRGGSKLTGATVDIVAQVSWLDVLAKARAEAYAVFVASAFADAHLDVFSDVFVKVLEGTATNRTTITGTRGVDIEARHVGGADAIKVKRDVYVIAVAIVWPQEGRLRGSDSLTEKVDVDKGLVVVGARTDVAGTPVTVTAATEHVQRRGPPASATATASFLRGTAAPTAAWRSDIPYYVVGATADSFKLSRTYGGDPITMTGAGTAVTVQLDRLSRRGPPPGSTSR